MHRNENPSLNTDEIDLTDYGRCMAAGFGMSIATGLVGGFGGLVYATFQIPMSPTPGLIGAGIGFGVPVAITTLITAGKLINDLLIDNLRNHTCHWKALDCCGLFSKKETFQDPEAGFSLLNSNSL